MQCGREMLVGYERTYLTGLISPLQGCDPFSPTLFYYTNALMPIPVLNQLKEAILSYDYIKVFHG